MLQASFLIPSRIISQWLTRVLMLGMLQRETSPVGTLEQKSRSPDKSTCLTQISQHGFLFYTINYVGIHFKQDLIRTQTHGKQQREIFLKANMSTSGGRPTAVHTEPRSKNCLRTKSNCSMTMVCASLIRGTKRFSPGSLLAR